MALPYALNPFGINGNNKNIPLTFTSVHTSRHWIRLSVAGTVDASGLKYRLGNSGDWLDYIAGTLIYIDPGTSIQFMNTKNVLGNSAVNYCNFGSAGKVKASGNIMSMLNWREDAPSSCFTYLFANFANLVTPPELPAKIIANRPYFSMFINCTSLISAPNLPATNFTGTDCYRNMFNGCTSLTSIPNIVANSLPNNACYAMFEGCTSLTNAILPATSLGIYSYCRMFYGCTSLQSVKIDAPILADNCCRNMFTSCSSISNVEVNFTDWNTEGTATANWFGGNPIDGTFIKPIALPEQRGGSRIPTNWTIINK